MDRPKTLGGSDAQRIMSGDWLALYNEKMWLQPPADLSKVFRVQLGICTESLHRDWFEKRETVVFNTEEDCFIDAGDRHANLDGWCPAQERAVEFKHTNEHNDLRTAAKYYMPQLTHYMHVTSTPDIWLSIIRGNNEPEWGLVEFNEAYHGEYNTALTAFQWHLDNETPPVSEEPEVVQAGKSAAATTVIDGLIDVDMQGNNQWGDFVDMYISNKQAAKAHEEAKKCLKEMMTDEMASVSGNGITIKRSKSGSKLFKEDK